MRDRWAAAAQARTASAATIVQVPIRAAVLDAVAAAGAFLIEDDFARDLTIDGHPAPPLIAADANGHVIYIRSLTKPAARNTIP
jgi:DNA-binding transcriptional MocR family regulator